MSLLIEAVSLSLQEKQEWDSISNEDTAKSAIEIHMSFEPLATRPKTEEQISDFIWHVIGESLELYPLLKSNISDKKADELHAIYYRLFQTIDIDSIPEDSTNEDDLPF